jgi:hypothetical protein
MARWDDVRDKAPGLAAAARERFDAHRHKLLARFSGEQEYTAPGAFGLFRVDVTELTVIRVGTPADHLVIESWSSARGLNRVERR